MNKKQRRNHFILQQLETQASAFADQALEPIDLRDINAEQFRSAVMAAYVKGAGAALDAEDGTVRS